MKRFFSRLFQPSVATLFTALALLAAGCATQKTDWNARIGNYTFDQAVTEYGPPDKQAKLGDGTVVAEWLTHHGYNRAYLTPAYCGPGYGPYFPYIVDTSSPDYFLRLTFRPDGELGMWKRFAK